MNTAVNLRYPYNTENFLTKLATITSLRCSLFYEVNRIGIIGPSGTIRNGVKANLNLGNVNFPTKLIPNLSGCFDSPNIHPSGLLSVLSAYTRERILSKRFCLHFCVISILGLSQTGKSST